MPSNHIYDYIEGEYRIIPLWNIRGDGSCQCGNIDCSNQGKHPRITNWNNVPLWSDEQISVMSETGQLDTGFGVVVDERLVVDVDPRNGGFESLEKLNNAIGLNLIDESGFTVSTGGGGYHIYFSNVPPIVVKFSSS